MQFDFGLGGGLWNDVNDGGSAPASVFGVAEITGIADSTPEPSSLALILIGLASSTASASRIP